MEIRNAADLIRHYHLQPHPEGGWFRELHRSRDVVACADGQQRCALTTILYLLEAGQLSCWHRLQAADEAWCFLAGAALELHLLPPDGGEATCWRLDSPLQDPDAQPMLVVPAGWWQAARSLGGWSLVSCAVGPGFRFEDFSLMRDQAPEDRPSGASPELIGDSDHPSAGV